MKFAISFVLIVICFSYCEAKTSESFVVSAIIKSMKKPSVVLATLCWSDREKAQFYRVLAETKSPLISTQFVDIDQPSKPHGQDQHLVFVVDLNCQNITNYLEKKQQESYFRLPFRWIFIGVEDVSVIVPFYLSDIDILPESEVLAVREIKSDFFEIHSFYKISTNNTWRTEVFGNWNMKSKLMENNQTSKSIALRRLDLEGFAISICYVLTDRDSINHLTDEVNDHVDTITKVNFPTTNHLLDFLNASRRYIFADTWGYKVNGSWNGMTGYLVREEVEIGGSPMFFTTERMSIIDYIASPTPTRSKFVFQQPKLSYENNLFLLSFRKSVWYSSLGLIILILMALLLVATWEWKKDKSNLQSKIKSPGVLRANFADVVILIFGAVCQQGSPTELKGSLGRTVMLILFLALMFLYTSYSANIVALLQSSSSQIRTLEDLLHSRLKFGVHDTVFNRYYFSTSTEPVRKAIYEKKVAPPGATPRFISMDEGVQNMRKGLFAFHMETGVGYKFVGKYFNEGEKCGLREIQYLQVIDPWLAVRKNTPYKEMFKIGMKRIQEHGLQSRENHLLYEKRPKCSGRGSNFVSVSMVDCYPALLILSYGCLLSLLLLAFEYLLYQRQIVIKKLSCINEAGAEF